MGAPTRRVVYVVAKAPRPGSTKTRLCPPLTHAQAARLAQAFVADTLALVRAAGVDVRLICQDGAERAALESLAPETPTHVQDGDGLSAAMESALVFGARDGYEATGVLGMDTPSLPPRVLSDAFDALADADVVLGPSRDGGYYLLAARRAAPALFRDMAWSTDQVAAETRRRCAAQGLRLSEVQEWDDVDDLAALLRLRAALESDARLVAHHTSAALAALRDALPAAPGVRSSL